MKKIYYSIFLLLGFTISFVACETEEELVEAQKEKLQKAEELAEASSGDADFDTYVAIGNSLTAGFMDGALYTRGQSNSFPNLLAARFAAAGGGEFNQPDINSENGFNTSFNDPANAFTGPATFGKLVLDLTIPGPVPTTPGDVMNMVDVEDREDINNLGVPGMRLIELNANGYGMLNPFYTRFALDPSTTSIIEQALAKEPTFMTFWLGNNDALSWATGGGVGPDGQDEMGNPNGQDAETNALVSEFSFNAALQGNLQAMFGTFPDLQGVILNVPNVTLIPYFQAVAYNAIPMDQATADATNSAYAGYNAALQGLQDPALAFFGFSPALTPEEVEYRSISFAAGNNAVVVEDDGVRDLADGFDALESAGAITAEQRAALVPFEQVKQLKSATDEPGLAPFGLPAELLTLPSGSVLGTLADPGNPASVIGVGVPLGDQYTLTVDEIAKLLTRITAFNTTISTTAANYANLHVFDANALFTSIAVNGGYTIDNGFTYSPDFRPNGIFSTDGIHPNPAGHAILANEIMAVIEANFNAELPRYDVSEFSTVLSAQ